MRITVILALCAFVMAGGAYAAEGNVNTGQANVTEGQERQDGFSGELKEDGTREIRVEAFQYGFSPDPVRVKKDDKVRILLASRDVSHGFSLADYWIDVRAKKGEDTVVEFIAKKAGTFTIVCSVYCGSGHSHMRGKLIVEE